jgi:MFS-type transporter involved in bile tolerance (Atg22 family)
MDIPMQMESSRNRDDSLKYSSRTNRRPLPKFYPKWMGKPVYDGNAEALAFALNNTAFMIQFVGAGAFLATAILRIATQAYVCYQNLELDGDVDIDVAAECGTVIKSFDPSSLLTAYAMVIGLIAAIMLPFMGAVVDYTRHRLFVGRFTSVLYTIFIFPLMFLTTKNYLIILACHAIAVFVSWFVVAIQHSYLPDLTDCELQLNHFSKWITICTYAGSIIYLAVTIGIVFLLGKSTDYIFTSRLGMIISVSINVIMVTWAWWGLFNHRPPLHQRPEKGSLCGLGFKQLYSTGCHIVKNYRSLKWFYVALCFSDAGWQSFMVVMVTYFISFLGFTPFETSICIVISLLGSMPGTVAASFLSRKLNPLQASKINFFNMTACIIVFVSVLNGPGQQVRAYCIVAFIGFCGGWKYNLDRLLGASIIPKGQDTELMGFYLFSGQCLGWLPLLVFTILNGTGLSPRINTALLIVYLGIFFTALCLIGSYPRARAQVGRDSVYNDDADKCSTVEEDVNAANMVETGVEACGQ